MELAISILEYEHYGVIPHSDYGPVEKAASIIVSREPENIKIEKLESMSIDVTKGNNALIRIAARNGNLKLVIWLVSRGGDITADDHYCMKWAIRYNHIDVVKYLIEQGEPVTEKHIVSCVRNCNLFLLKELVGVLPLTKCNLVELIVSAIEGNTQIEVLEYLFEHQSRGFGSGVREILSAAIFSGSVLTTSYVLSKIERADFIGIFIGIFTGRTGGPLLEFIETHLLSWTDGARYIYYIIQKDSQCRIDREILIRCLDVLLCWGKELHYSTLLPILHIVKRCKPTFDELVGFGRGAFSSFVIDILPYVTDTLYIQSIIPVEIEYIKQRITKLEHRAAVIIQRMWRKHTNATIWERIKSFGSFGSVSDRQGA